MLVAPSKAGVLPTPWVTAVVLGRVRPTTWWCVVGVGIVLGLKVNGAVRAMPRIGFGL